MKIVKLYAYLQNNVGDDLMVEILINRYPEISFWGCRGLQKKTKKLLRTTYFDSEDIYSRYGRLNHLINIFFKKNSDAVYRHVFRCLEEKCICAVSIGGSVYRQLDGQTIEKRMVMEERKKARHAPYFVIGANFGPFLTKDFYNGFHQHFMTCSGVSFRDRRSFELFRDIPCVQYAPDVVFNIPEGIISDDGKHILISVVNLKKRPQLKQYSFAYIKSLASICEFFLQQGKTPVLMSFCTAEGDEECVNEVFGMVKHTNRIQMKRYFYHGDTEELLGLFRNAHFIVATRFHAMVLAMRFRKPLFTVSYELKMDNVLEDTGSIAYCHVGEIADFAPQHIYELGKSVVNVDRYIDEAEKQFSQLDVFLREKL